MAKPEEKLLGDAATRLPRRAMIHGATVASAAAALGLMAGEAQAAKAGPFPAHPNWRFVFVSLATANPFFVPVRYGIADACALLGCTWQWTGSETSNVAEMVNAVDAAIASQADAIAVPIVDPQAFNAPTARAMEAGIPVFSYNSDAPPGSKNRRLAYIGQDLFVSGQMMGRRIVKLVQSGHVAIFITTPGQLNLQPRVDGAMAAIKQSGAPIKPVMIATDPTVNISLSKVRAYYLGHRNVKGMFGTGAIPTENIATVMEDYDLAKTGVQGGGFDLLPSSLRAVRAGYLNFVIDQQPYLQGFYTVMEMFLFKVSGGLSGPADIDTGLKFVTKATVAPYLTTSTRYEGGSAEPKIVARSGPILG
jgi:simple sugar transport system substrate-binding protein